MCASGHRGGIYVPVQAKHSRYSRCAGLKSPGWLKPQDRAGTVSAWSATSHRHRRRLHRQLRCSQLGIHIATTSLVREIIYATLGAIILLLVLRLVRAGGRWCEAPRHPYMRSTA